jgi:hypothetical protein
MNEQLGVDRCMHFGNAIAEGKYMFFTNSVHYTQESSQSFDVLVM